MKYICEFCGKEFERNPSRVKHGRGKHCSPECQYASIRARPRSNSVEFSCLNCGKRFSLYISTMKSKVGAGKYCSRTCRDEHRKKQNHPQYLNGESSEKRGPNWQAQKRKAIKRDSYTCQFCGSTIDIDVHHIIPFRKFGLERYKEANNLTNLISLCKPCHRREDAVVQRIQHI